MYFLKLKSLITSLLSLLIFGRGHGLNELVLVYNTQGQINQWKHSLRQHWKNGNPYCATNGTWTSMELGHPCLAASKRTEYFLSFVIKGAERRT